MLTDWHGVGDGVEHVQRTGKAHCSHLTVTDGFAPLGSTQMYKDPFAMVRRLLALQQWSLAR